LSCVSRPAASREIRPVAAEFLQGWRPCIERGTLRHGFDGHLIKPIDIDVLMPLLEERRKQVER
jgi:hypothetical protein